MNIFLFNRFFDNRYFFGEKKGCFLYRDFIGFIGDVYVFLRVGIGCDCCFFYG